MEFQVKGQTYRAGKLNAFQQFHVARRLAPLLTGLGGSLSEVKADPLAMFQPLAQGIASLPDADAEFILNTCLAVVDRRQGDRWARVFTPAGGLQFEDIALPAMLQIVGNVLTENFADFFGDLPAALSEPA